MARTAITEPIIRDPRHGIALPSGVALGRALAAVLRRQSAAALAGLREGRVIVPPVDAATVEALVPFMARHWQQGVNYAGRRTLRHRKSYHPWFGRWGGDGGTDGADVVHSSRPSLGTRKALIPLLTAAFDVFNPLTLDVLRKMTFDFLASMAATTADLLRSALAASLSLGETGKDLQRRLVPVFGQGRAFIVAQTEASRSVHAGQLEAAKESGVVTGRTWLASADACPACLAVDGKTVGLNEPFATGVGNNPAYSTIWHPPYHPFCMCSVTDEVG